MLILRIILLLVVSGGGLFAIRSIDAASEPQIGPYTEIQPPLEDLPALPEDQVYNPVVELTAGEPIRRPSYDTDGNLLTDDHSLDTLATAVAWHSEEELTRPYLQVLYVLEDPREVPLARYAYNSEAGVILPDDDMEQLAGQKLKTINVYVKTYNFSSQPVNDPLLASEYADTSWPALYVSPLNIELEGISQFPCAAVEYADGTEPYALPAGIDGGGGVGEDGLYDPAAYAPPRPWYYNDESALQPGEAREGWVSCLAPNVPLEQLQVKAKYKYLREPGVVTFDLYKPGVFFPDHEVLASIGLTLADLPGDVNQCDEQDYCASICSKATELTVKQGVCVLRSDNGDITSFFGFRINEYTEPAQRSYLAWAYTSANSFPASVIKLEDVPLTFYTDYYQLSYGAPLKTNGDVTFYDPRIVYSGMTIPRYENIEGDQLFFMARAKIELNKGTTENLQGHQQVEIEGLVKAHIEKEGEVLISSANIRSLDMIQEYDPVTGTLEVVVYGELGEGRVPSAEEGIRSPLLQNTALLNIYSNYEEAPFSDTRPGIYPVNVVTMYQQDSAFVSKTEMCEVVDCIDYFDEDDKYHHDVKDDHVPKPSRSIPVICAGEWANNVIIDGINNSSSIEYIGKPWGLVSNFWDLSDRIYFLYNLRIMGGATPWWNVIDRSQYDNDSLFGETVEINSGMTTYTQVDIVGYYSLIDKTNLSKGYFVPTAFDYENRGWMGEIIDQKVLAYNRIFLNDSILDNNKTLTVDDTGFLFMQEGPIWTAACQRDLLPVLSDQEMYAPQEVSLNTNTEEEPHDMSSLLPGMGYPLSLPLVDGKIFSMGEYGDIYPDNNLKFTVRAVEPLSGKPDEPVVYVPGEGKFYPADRKVSRNNTAFFHINNAFVMPPDTTYIRINIGVDHVGSGVGEEMHCRINYDDIQLIYPGYLPITGSPEVAVNNGVKESVCQGEDHTFWISYMFPSLDFDLEKMLISLHSIEQRPWNFWRLVKE
ncbi:MAG: hypothetical protein KAH12_06135 [Anaerolineales bacterium]|nr:hypothetical protein [Anaerolineales bacterium]